MKAFFSLLLLLIISVLYSHTIYGQSFNKSIEIAPALSEITLEKSDELKSVALTIANHTNTPVHFQISGLDFKQSDGGKLSFIGKESGVFSYSLASFLSLETDQLTVAPGEKKSFNVTIKNRQDLSPGGHYGAIIFKVINPLGADEGTVVSPSLSSLILLHKKGGERFNLSLTDMDFPKSLFAFGFPEKILLTFRNEGNIHLVPYGTIEIKDIFGRLTHKGAINISSLRIFPETQRYINSDLNEVAWSFPVSFNTVTVQGNDSLKKTHFSSQQTFIYINPYIIGIIILLLIVCLYLRRKK